MCSGGATVSAVLGSIAIDLEGAFRICKENGLTQFDMMVIKDSIDVSRTHALCIWQNAPIGDCFSNEFWPFSYWHN